MKDNQPKLLDLVQQTFLRYGEQNYQAPEVKQHRTGNATAAAMKNDAITRLPRPPS